MKNKKLIVVFCIALTGTVNSQIVGNPVGTKGTGKWSVSVNGGYMSQQLDQAIISRRLLLKSEWGITPWLDFYCIGGAYDLELDFSENEFTDFKSKMRFCYGTGVDLAYRPEGGFPVGIWTGAQIFIGPAKGEYYKNISFAGTTIKNKYKLEYSWSESKGFLGLIYYGKFFKIYVAGAGWLLQKTSTRKEYSKSGTTWSFEERIEGEDRSDILTGGILGLELDFPGNYALTFECMVFNQEDFHLMVGFSQTGTPGW